MTFGQTIVHHFLMLLGSLLFEEEQRSRRCFFDRISCEGTGFLRDESFDYFSHDDNNDEQNDLSNSDDS